MSDVDPYVESRTPGRFLATLNPLAKLAAPLPAIVSLIFVREPTIPVAFLIASYLIVLIGATPTRALIAFLTIAIPLAVVVLGLSLSLWTDPALVAGTDPIVSLGAWTLYSGALSIGLATGLRLGAIVALALITGVATNGPDLVRASVQQLRVPYRIGYTALAAFRFVPRFGHELDLIRQAHRVRGAHGGRGPFAALARWWGYIVPLLAGAIRHAERVALAMDSRAFGAHPDRTERHLVPWRRRDTVFIVLFWLGTAGILIAGHSWG